MYEELDCEIQGIAPLLCHNGHLADQLNPQVIAMKKISGKRNKTESDFLELAKLEWYGSLYLDKDNRPCIPGELIEAMMIQAGKKSKLGQQFKAGLICDGLWPITYSGSKDLEKLWENKAFRDMRGVIVSRSRVMRTRPVFHEWSLKFKLHYLPGLLNKSQVKDAMEVAGQIVGLGNYRPKFGRFVVAK